MAKKPDTSSRIADNKKAAFNYFFEERFEAGIVLEGWEVKSLREGKVQLTDGYVVVRNGELFIIGLQINPLGTASTHISPDKQRTKIADAQGRIKRLIGKVEQKAIPQAHQSRIKNGKVKCEIARLWQAEITM
jgi:SsrA-binding protein